MPSAEHPVAGSVIGPASSSSPKKPFSLSLSKSKSTVSLAPKTTALYTKKRPHSSLAEDSDSDHDVSPVALAVTGFVAGGAVGFEDPSKEKAPLVIVGQKNRNWREEHHRKRGKNLLPAEEQAARAGRSLKQENAVMEEEAPVYGLVLAQVKDTEGDTTMEGTQTENRIEVRVDQKLKTADEEALEALLGDGTKKSMLVVPAIKNEDGDDEKFTGRASGEDAYKSDIASRPDSASLDDYAAVPVEEFGAAMLRGMGWVPGSAVGRRKMQDPKLRAPVRRPDKLGIGAKEVPEGLEADGAWGKAAKNNGPMKYSPVMLRNNKTGEVLTEDEMKARREGRKDQTAEQKKKDEDWRERRDRNLAIDEGRKANQKQIKNASHEGSRHSSSRRERSRSSERRKERRRDDREDLDRREKERPRDQERDHYDRKDSERRYRPRDEERDDSRSAKPRHRGRKDYEDDTMDSRPRPRDRERYREENNDTRSHRRR